MRIDTEGQVAQNLGTEPVAQAYMLETNHLQLQKSPPPGASGRSGAPRDQVSALVDRILETEGLRLRGVMGVAPLGGDAAAAFADLAEVAADVRRSAPGATWISAGMSGDLEEAIGAGATHLRIGSAVLGTRPVVK